MSDAFLGIGEDKEILWVSCGKEGIIERAYMYRVLYIHTYIISIYVYICHVYMNKIWSAVSIADLEACCPHLPCYPVSEVSAARCGK